MRNGVHYIERTAGEAIRMDDRQGKNKQMKPWGDRLTYRIGM
jgi:hypothetical protein